MRKGHSAWPCGHLALEPVCAADLSGFTTRAGVVIGDAKAEPFAIELAWVSDPPLRDLSQKLWNLGTRHAIGMLCLLHAARYVHGGTT